MGIEAATYISDLVVTNPVSATDPVSQGDDHIRLLKSVLKATLPNINAAISVTDEEINRLAGVTGDVEPMRGLPYTDQAAPYTLVQLDNGSQIDITSAGIITLPNLANNFACMLGAIAGNLTLTSTSGTLSFFSAAGVALGTGDRTVLRGSLVGVHRRGGAWRCFGPGII
jgi:hypothetical protein